MEPIEVLVLSNGVLRSPGLLRRAAFNETKAATTVNVTSSSERRPEPFENVKVSCCQITRWIYSLDSGPTGKPLLRTAPDCGGIGPLWCSLLEQRHLGSGLTTLVQEVSLVLVGSRQERQLM